MANTNYGELRQLFETFTRVWEAGGQTSLHLFTKDGQAKAMLEIQLGPPAAPRPGAPDLHEEGPGLHHGPQHHKEQTHQRPRRRGPAARARDAARRATWLRKQEERQQAAPAEESLETSEPADAASEETLESSETMGAVMEAASTETIESGATDVASDELSCDLCEHRSETNGGLKIHIGRKHKEIPQLDGDIELERDTDDWWDNNSTESMKIFQTYKDVLEEIQESSLTEEEKYIEIERATEGRKKGFGNNHIYFPPWKEY